MFGELDDVSPYSKLGKKHRLPFEELFDVSNLLEDGSIAPLDSHRAAMNKVNLFSVYVTFLIANGSKRAIAFSTLTAPSILDEQVIASLGLMSFRQRTQGVIQNMPILARHTTTFPTTLRKSSSKRTTSSVTHYITRENSHRRKLSQILILKTTSCPATSLSNVMSPPEE